MTSLILRTAARYLVPLLLLFSIFTLLRGHNLPGGGFAGGLLAATAVALYIFAWDAADAKRAIPIDSHLVIGIGLAIVIASGLGGMLAGDPFLTGKWAAIGKDTAIGTPLLFDVGVYLVVFGASVMMIFSLTGREEKR
ncbi:MAG TPA: Na+/H+ antiporter subunit B [Thermoanaerobaculia bacterium]